VRAGEDGLIRRRRHAAARPASARSRRSSRYKRTYAVRHGRPGARPGAPRDSGRADFNGSVNDGIEQAGLAESVARSECAEACLGVGADAGGDEGGYCARRAWSAVLKRSAEGYPAYLTKNMQKPNQSLHTSLGQSPNLDLPHLTLATAAPPMAKKKRRRKRPVAPSSP